LGGNTHPKNSEVKSIYLTLAKNVFFVSRDLEEGKELEKFAFLFETSPFLVFLDLQENFANNCKINDLLAETYSKEIQTSIGRSKIK
jgi:hypothetical protein